MPQALSGAYNPTNGTYIDLIAMLIVVAVTFWVSLEAKTALRLNNLMVFREVLGLFLLFVLVGIFLCETNELATIYSLWFFSGVFQWCLL